MFLSLFCMSETAVLHQCFTLGILTWPLRISTCFHADKSTLHRQTHDSNKESETALGKKGMNWLFTLVPPAFYLFAPSLSPHRNSWQTVLMYLFCQQNLGMHFISVFYKYIVFSSECYPSILYLSIVPAPNLQGLHRNTAYQSRHPQNCSTFRMYTVYQFRRFISISSLKILKLI